MSVRLYGKDDTKKLINLSENKWDGTDYLEALFLDFFKWDDSGKTEFKILPQTKPSAKISPDKEKLGGWFSWWNEMYSGFISPKNQKF